MYRMVVTDFDGTLINKDEAIPISTIVEIDRIRKNNKLFVIATGRILKSILIYNRDFPFIDYVIALNGAYVYDVNLKKVIYKENIKASIVKKLQKLYSNNNIYFCSENNWNLLNVNNDKPRDNEDTISSFDSFYNANKNNVYKMEIHFKSKKERDKAYLEIEEMALDINLYKQMYDKVNLIEITARGINKFTGVKKICDKEKIKVEEVIGIGDSLNDYELIENCGLGVVVSNANKDLKKIAQMKTSSNELKGVEKIIKKLV